MKSIEKNFFWLVLCFALVVIHITFVVFDVNVYQEMFWSYVIGLISVVILAAIVFSRMEGLMKIVGTKVIITKYKKILGSFSFWWIFIVFTLLLYIDAYAFGQLFLPEDQVTKLFLPDLNEWSIYLPFSLMGTAAIIHSLRAIIKKETNE